MLSLVFIAVLLDRVRNQGTNHCGQIPAAMSRSLKFMNDPTSRALRLLSLLQTHRFWSGSELVEELEVSARTVRRDVDRLRELGYPVDATTGAAGGYRLAKGASLPPLLLDDEEAVAVAVGLRSAAGAAISGIEDTSLRALTKLEQVLPDRLRRKVNAIHSNVSTLQWNRGGPVVDAETLALIAVACRDQEEIRFEYEARDKVESRRLVEPHQLVSVGRKWYLVAFDLRRDDWRTFRLDRISKSKLAGQRFTIRELPAPTYAEYVSRSISSASLSYEAHLIASCPSEHLEQFAKYSGSEITAVENNRTAVTIRGESPDWVLALTAMVACTADIQVVSPPEFRERLSVVATRLSNSVDS
jgi:predicted DNA-binding transcriptional regulator YafY